MTAEPKKESDLFEVIEFKKFELDEDREAALAELESVLFDDAAHTKDTEKLIFDENDKADTAIQDIADQLMKLNMIDDENEETNKEDADMHDDHMIADHKIMLKFVREDVDTAIEYYERMKETDEFASVFHLGVIYLCVLKDIDPAYENLKRAIEIGPETGMLHYYFAGVCIGKRDFELAVKHLKKAQELKPNVQRINKAMAKAQKYLKRAHDKKKKEAKKEAQKINKIAAEKSGNACCCFYSV